MKVRITEHLDIDLEKETWCCNRCGRELGSARENYKKLLLVNERDPREVYSGSNVNLQGYTLGPDPEWCRILEFYCTDCAAMFEVEYLPSGHPITHDIELDIDALRRRYVHRNPASE